MFPPAVAMAQTHADQLRRNADTWRERRLARRGAEASAAALALRSRRSR